MLELVRGLSALSALRDRDALDLAMLDLLARCMGAQADLSLLRILHSLKGMRCRQSALRAPGQAAQLSDARWHELDTLEVLADFPLRQKANTTGEWASLGGAPCTTVFAVEGVPGANTLLEVCSPQPLPAEVVAQVQCVLHTGYQLHDLLDYGDKDALTELLNRKSFDRAFLKAAMYQDDRRCPVTQERRLDPAVEHYWLAVMDIDHFKSVNDRYGHMIGDEVLLLMARLMRASFRMHDQLYRFGGEEFVVLMRCADHGHAMAMLERFRRTVEVYDFPQVGRITVSQGFAILRPDDTPSSVFGRADQAVYFAKAHGRNQVCSYQSLVEQGLLQEQTQDTSEADFF